MNIMRWKYLFFAISGIFLIPGLISLLLWRLNPSIDFTGGSLLEIQINQSESISSSQIEENISQTYQVESVQSSGENQFIIRAQEITNEQKESALQNLRQIYPEISEQRFETVGPVLGQELLQKMMIAIVLAAVFITIYIWRQFNQLKYGVSAIIAVFHDTLIVLGMFSLLGHFFHIEVGVLFVTALLTTLSFSVHDTIVVFDRIRELRRLHIRMPYQTIVNTAVLETMGRSVNNSMTIIFMLTALVLLGGESIRWFAVALLIGSITGTYSSSFVAVPLLLVWEDIRTRLHR